MVELKDWKSWLPNPNVWKKLDAGTKGLEKLDARTKR
jgi:hypothetical protein